MKPRPSKAMISLLSLCLLLSCSSVLLAVGYSMITKEDLRSMQGQRGLIILDVRPGTSWMFSMSKIKGAVRENPNEVDSWENKYPKDEPIVVYCQTDVTSMGVGRKLAASGFQSVYVLKGGWKEWSDAKFPTENK